MLAMLPVSTGYSHTAGLAKSETESKVRPGAFAQNVLEHLLPCSVLLSPKLKRKPGHRRSAGREFWLSKTVHSARV